MWIRSWDIRDQSRKLSEIAQNFGRFFGPPKFFGACLPKIAPSLSLLPRGTSTEKVSWTHAFMTRFNSIQFNIRLLHRSQTATTSNVKQINTKYNSRIT